MMHDELTNPNNMCFAPLSPSALISKSWAAKLSTVLAGVEIYSLVVARPSIHPFSHVSESVCTVYVMNTHSWQQSE